LTLLMKREKKRRRGQESKEKSRAENISLLPRTKRILAVEKKKRERRPNEG